VAVGVRVFILLAVLFFASALRADTTQNPYGEFYQKVIAAARGEGELVIYSSVPQQLPIDDLLAAFRRHYPFVTIKNTYNNSGRIYKQFVAEVAAKQTSADVLWSSAMDLQEKLINDGYAQPYDSPELRTLPPWAHWQNLGYGTTLEPICFVYNSRFLGPTEMPQTHGGLRDLLRGQPQRFVGRVALHDPENSEVGMLFLSQDARITPDSWRLFAALRTIHAKGRSNSWDILSNIVSGDQWMGYDVISSFALQMQKTHPELRIVYPSDFMLTMTRVAFISASAKHPNTAKLFVDFLLSKEGQEHLEKEGMGSVRTDMPSSEAAKSSRIVAIRIGPGLLSDLDSLVRAQFITRWRQSVMPTPFASAR
jgi:iron(III) transport system substrate-binding protein